MSILELWFSSGEDSLSVRRFSVHEQMSSLFSVSVWALSRNDDIDLETIVGQDASLRTVSGTKHALASAGRRWSGVVSHMELMHAEPSGLSTYYLRIVPRMWLLTQRTNHRIFQHMSVPDIVDKMLGDWSLERVWKIDKPAYPKLELRAQYGESDYDFVNRLLEEAGISYCFANDPEKGMQTVLHDAPQSAEPREGGPLSFVDNPSQSAEQEFVSQVRIAQQVRPGKVTVRDFDFRRAPRLKFFGTSTSGKAAEELLEQYKYLPGHALIEMEEKGVQKLGALVDKSLHIPDPATAIGKKAKEAAEKKVHGLVDEHLGNLVDRGVAKVAGEKAGHLVGGAIGDAAGEVAGKVAGKLAGALTDKVASGLGIAGVLGKLVGDDKGMARHSEKAAAERAGKALEAARAAWRSVTFETNALDLGPGMVLCFGKHSRTDLGPDKKLLVTEFSVEGTNDGEWSMDAHATFADVPYRPPLKTPKPSIQGLQSAVVVGPVGEEIHTDEFGRVRVQFHWDREGGFDEGSSCWMRVSQGWAGSGYGMIAIPRVGQEVLVAFLEGDPDNPVVVGRLYNATSPVPYDLPEHKTRSGWRTDSSPGSGGFNEIMFEDAKARELVYLQAERDFERVVKRNEAVSVGEDRRTSIGAVDESHVGERYSRTMRQAEGDSGKFGPTFIDMMERRIHLSTGEASITLDGPNITLQAKGRIFIHSSDNDVELLGGPWVKINCDPPKDGESDTVTMHHITGIIRDQDQNPLPGQKIIVKASDGFVQQVESDSSGRYFALVQPGECQVSLPQGHRYGNNSVNLDEMNNDPEHFNDCGPAA